MHAKNQKRLLILSLTVILATGFTVDYALAQEENEDFLMKDAFNEMVTGIGEFSGAGIVAAIAMSVFRVIGKNIKSVLSQPEGDKKPKVERFNVAKLLVTVLIGAVAGAILHFTGIPQEAAFGLDFFAIYVANNLFRPIFAKWELK